MVRAASDTVPINYLILIVEVGLLPRLFATVLVPDAVADELRHPLAPQAVRDWIAAPPPWLIVTPAPPIAGSFFPALGRGERAAIALAEASPVDIVLMDDRAGVSAAASRGLRTVGTLGLLARAAQRGLTSFSQAVGRLKATNFRVRATVLDELIARHSL
jgi:predicted nucleic acid-binding protein